MNHEKTEDPHLKHLYQMYKNNRNNLLIVAIAIVLIIGSNFAIVMIFKNKLTSLHQNQVTQQEEAKLTNQFLLSTIDWSTRRTKMILFMRDIILHEWKVSGYKGKTEEAFTIAEADVYECEYYKNVDPFALLGLQCIESRFQHEIVSNMGAVGLNQILPSTGRLLCKAFGYSYSERELYDIKKSTKLAVGYLDLLYSTYNNLPQVLADYNGGPYQAWFYKHSRSRLMEETSKFVPNVLAKKAEYDSAFAHFKLDETLTCKMGVPK